MGPWVHQNVSTDYQREKSGSGGHMAPPCTFFSLVISGDIFRDPDPFVNSYFGLSFDLRCYLAQSDIFEVLKEGKTEYFAKGTGKFH